MYHSLRWKRYEGMEGQMQRKYSGDIVVNNVGQRINAFARQVITDSIAGRPKRDPAIA